MADWRRRRGTKTDAHLWAGEGHHPYDQRPVCGKRIRHMATEPVYFTPLSRPISRSGRYAVLKCSSCLVAAIGGVDYGREYPLALNTDIAGDETSPPRKNHVQQG